MKSLIKFVFIGFIFIIFVEFAFKFLATFNPKGYFIASIFYPFYLILIYFLSSLLDRVFPNKLVANVIAFFLFGFMGLFIEWNLLGNSPSGNPNANQIGMFAFWAVYCCMPRLFLDSETSSTLKLNIKRFFGLNVIVTFLIAVILHQPAKFVVIMYLQVVVYVLFSFFIFYYWKSLAQR